MNSRNYILKKLQEIQPIQYTGAIWHSLKWVATLFVHPSYVYKNPHYRESENRTVIYCIHGTFDGPNAFMSLAPRLVAKGLPANIAEIRIVKFDGRYRGNDIKYFASQLLNQIKANHDTNVTLIGHSRGGLIASYFTENLAAENNINVHHVVAICSPFKGSHRAVAPLTMISHSVDQMQEGSDFLRELTPKIAVSKVPYHYFAAKKDDVVQPYSACIDEHRHRLQILDREHGHLSILSSHQLVDRIVSNIDDNIPVDNVRSSYSTDHENESSSENRCVF